MLNVKATDQTAEVTLRDFSEGRITRQCAMYILDIDYSDLWDLMGKHDLSLPELSDKEALVEGRKMADFLGAMGV